MVNISPHLLLAASVLFHTAAAQEWTINTVAWGAKPVIALDNSGVPHFAYMYEQATNGWLRHAVWNPGTMDYDTTTVSLGYFYGPPAIAIDLINNPGINFHRHTPVPEQMYSHFNGTSWTTEAIVSPNHDGWDNSLQYDSNNRPRTSTTDPSNFGPTSTGVEYAAFDGSSWTVEAIGSARIDYFSGTSLELDAGDNPHITYYDDITADLLYAVKTGASWSITPVETVGDVGRFSSLELDVNDNPRISYYEELGDSMGLVKYASWTGSGWDITVIDTLKRVFINLARTTTSLALDAGGTPHISYGDEKVIRYATLDGNTWVIETVVDVNNLSTLIGQSNSIAVADDGTVHITYYELLTRAPITGIVKHAVREPSEPSIPCEEIDVFRARCSANGTALAMVQLLNSTQYEGMRVRFDLDGTAYPVVLMSNGTHTFGRLQIPQAGAGPHTITLVEPAGCYDPVNFMCRVDIAEGNDDFDDFWKDLKQPETGGVRITEVFGNYPNPFNPSTTITYSVAGNERVTLKVFNSLGEEIVTLVNEVQTPGTRSVTWNGRAMNGAAVTSGIYLYRLSAGSAVITGKMLLMK